MEKMTSLAVVSTGFCLSLLTALPALATNVYIDVSSGTPVVSSNDIWFAPLGGATSVTQIIPGGWAISFSMGGVWNGFGGPNRGLELTDLNTGKLVDSFGVDSVSWSGFLDYTTVYSQLYIQDSAGDVTGRTPRINNAPVSTAVEIPGEFQLAMSNMHTAYTSFDVYLKGFSVNASPVPLPSALWLFGSAVFGVVGLSRSRLKRSVV